MPLFKWINDVSNNEKSRKAWFSLVFVIFVTLIIIPSIFVVLKMFTEWGLVSEVFDDPVMMSTITGALWNSFSIAGIVTVIDILVGIPMAWIFVRKQFKGKKYLDTLMDMPLAFPTAVLGISVVMFWGAPDGISIPAHSARLVTISDSRRPIDEPSMRIAMLSTVKLLSRSPASSVKSADIILVVLAIARRS